MTTPDRNDLPIADYDHLTVATLGQRVRALDAEQVQALLDHESAHGDRLVITELLRTRLADLASGAEPSGADPDAATPEGQRGSDAVRRTDPQVDSPAINPPSQGDPTNPAQPR